MKTLLFAFCVLCTASALGQVAGSISSEAHMTQVPDHPMYAQQHDMGQESSLFGTPAYTVAQGERPLWEFGPVSAPPPPLGDTARAYRKEHALVKKAEVVWEK